MVVDKDCINPSSVESPALISPKITINPMITDNIPFENIFTTKAGIIPSVFKASPLAVKSGNVNRAYNPTNTTEKKIISAITAVVKNLFTSFSSFKNKDLVMICG